MRINSLKAIFKTGVRAATVLLVGAGLASAQSSVDLTAGHGSFILPDGNSVPMWGYTCGTAALATCAPLGTGAWSPVLITVPAATSGPTILTINLTNNLTFGANSIPTSLTIVGQLGGGLGTAATATPSPAHGDQGTTWPIANTGPVFTPPTQKDRVQSFSTEVPAGSTTALTWNNLRPGTYLIESGTHPSIQGPMGLYGILVVTTAPSGATPGTAYPLVNYNAEVPLLFSEIDPTQNRLVDAAVNAAGFSESATLSSVPPGPLASIDVITPGHGYSAADVVVFTGGGGSGAVATLQVDSTTGAITGFTLATGGTGYTSRPTVSITTTTGTGATEIAQVTSVGSASTCSGGALACYPSVVNYTPLYYLINGVAFDKTNTAKSSFPASPGSGVTGNVLVRMVNAGLRMHVPSIVGSQTSFPGTASSAAPAGFSLIAEDGNPLPGLPRVQSEVFMAAGKTYDVMIDVPSGTNALPIFDRQLSLSANSVSRDGGMLAYISVNGAGVQGPPSSPAHAEPDSYPAIIAGQALTVSDPSRGVIANDTNVYGVQLFADATNGKVTLNPDGTFTYAPNTGSMATSDSFTYCANGGIVPASGSNPATCPANLIATVTLAQSALVNDGVSCTGITFHARTNRQLVTKTPGVLEGCKDGANLPLTVDLDPTLIHLQAGLTVALTQNGGFTASLGTACGVQAGCPYTFTFQAKNPLGTHSADTTTTVVFPMGSGLVVKVMDGSDKTTEITDYKWIIEEDRTFFVDKDCVGTSPASGCPVSSSTAKTVNFGTNFHTSSMPLIASGCTGMSQSCGEGQSVQGDTSKAPPHPASMPGDVALCTALPTGATPADTPCLDPKKRYYISVLPGDGAQPFINGYAGAPDCSTAGVAAGSCGHGMGGAPVPAPCKIADTACSSTFAPVTVYTEPSPYPPATLSVFVFEDDYPLNGEHDAGGGVDVLAPQEPGLGGFQITLFDDAGGTGDATGQPTYDMFNMPLTNSLAGTIDPVTHADACPISTQVTDNVTNGDGSQKGIVGMIVTCPTYESDGTTLSPLAGQATVNNLYQGRYGVVAMPGADRFNAGEEWLQTNTLDGQKAHDSFMRIGEPGYFQEFGPAGYHVSIGFANPKIINSRMADMCAGKPSDYCKYEVKGHVTTARMSRTPDERLYGSGTHDSYGFTQCYISLGDPDGAEFGFQKCDADGNFDFTGLPPGNWKITTFDQWNDQVVDGITTTTGLCQKTFDASNNPVYTNCATGPVDMGEVAVHQWQANIYTRSFIDLDGNGVSSHDHTGVQCTGDNIPAGCNANYGNDTEPGLALVPTNIRFRDGSFSNFNSTDLNGYAGFNEVFPLFNWYVVETDSTRYKSTGTHVVYDSGGPVDGSKPLGESCTTGTKTKLCGNSTIAANLANTYEYNPLPADLSIPGAVYCSQADCTDSETASFAAGIPIKSSATASTGRIDPPWVSSYGWQGYSGQNNFLEFGKKPFAAATPTAPAENGGIHGHVVYASTRPFDDPQMLLQLSWEPLVPHVKLNLYKEDLASDGVTQTLTLVDHTETSSFDDWAQGFRKDAAGNPIASSTGGYIPNMNCPGQGTDTTTLPDPYFWFVLQGQPQWLDVYSHPTTTPMLLAHGSQFKCYDGMHNWNQLQPAPYDGMYSFPSVVSLDPVTGKPTGTGSTNGTPGTQPGTNCIACIPNPDASDHYRNGTAMLPAGKYVVEVVVPEGYELVKEEDKNILIGDNFIAPVTQQFGGLGSIFILPDQADVTNSYNPQNTTNSLGRNSNLPSHEGDTGSVETFWPCVGEMRTVPDFISLFPGSAEVAPFAGATRPLCDRKEVTLTDESAALAKFYVFTETHLAAHFTGVITDDFTAEFDPFSPQFGEKYAPPYLPVSIKDWAGNEIQRVYSDAWGAYNGLSYSTWEVNPPNPTGYGPTMMVTCMNDSGSGATPDPLFQEGYSQFCYELPFMPGQTGYFDTPVVPTAAFAGGYNNPDCAYPDLTPSIKEVHGDVAGPWVASAGGAIQSVTVTNGGTGYTSAPTVSFSATTGTAATATAVISGKVTAVTLSNPTTNRGYSSAPTVTLGGGGGSGATATAVMTPSVTSVTINTGGSYSNGGTLNVTFSAPGGTGTTATGTVQTVSLGGGRRAISGIAITNAGSGYSVAPTLTFTLTGSPAATYTVIMGQSVRSVTVGNNGGSGYTSAPSVTFTGSASVPATATSTISKSVVAVNVINGGSGYTNPTVSFSGGGGTGATATATLSTGGKLTITSLGKQPVDNYEYVGPSSTVSPFNKQKITRDYGFGTTVPTNFTKFPTLTLPQHYSCNAGNDPTAVCPYVTVGGLPMSSVAWSDTQITGNVPAGVPNCAVQQQAQFGGKPAQCGELAITAANLNQSVDTVTVTIGGSTPKFVSGTTPLTVSGFGSIQQAIDGANPGDLIIVPPGVYKEMILMWKPVRLQGVGAASSIIDANPQPAKLDPWRRQVDCLFGLALNGQPSTGTSGGNPFDSSGTFTCPGAGGGPNYPAMVVDRIPMEGILGWDTTVNGNLAEQLIEPSLMGAYEGAGITVLAKGVFIPAGSADVFGSGAESAFPAGSRPLNVADCTSGPGGTNQYTSNYLCNPSSIDGLTVKNSSQGGGGILVHAWAHNLQIANNRVMNNQGTLSGGITVGQGEHPDVPLVGGGVATIPPGSCVPDGSATANLALPYCYDLNVNVHHNQVVQNSSLGDELFSSTPAGAGGVTICNGSDYYKFNYNWVCGNLSTGDGAGVAHIGFSYNGDIEHNTIEFNQSTNPTITTNGGGLLIMGAPDPDPPCSTNDQDCLSSPGAVTPSDGVGPGLIINANLILGNSADSGSGGGLRLQHVNGTDVVNFPSGNTAVTWPGPAQPSFQLGRPWNSVSITNNIISNNVAGWDGGGVSMLDALRTSLVNNTIISNNSTASSGVLFQSLFAPLASTEGINCHTGTTTEQSCAQPAGLVSVTNSSILIANLPGPVTCPTGFGTGGNCAQYSVPALNNNIFWHNRSMVVSFVDGAGQSTNNFTNQQNTISVFNPGFGGTASSLAAKQTATGECNDTNASYWDIGVRGDTGPGDHTGGVLAPTWSLLTNASEVGSGTNNLAGNNPTLTGEYCNGALVPVEAQGSVPGTPYAGWLAPPGTNEANALPAPPFTLQAAATVDEGNNWINIHWGPLSTSVVNTAGTRVFTFDANQKAGSPVIDYIPLSQVPAPPPLDFYGNARPDTTTANHPRFDIGAIEYQTAVTAPILVVSPSPLAFGSVVDGTTTTLDLTLRNDGAGTTPTIAIAGLPSNNFTRVTTGAFPTGAPNCGANLAAGNACSIRVQFAPPIAASPANYSATLTITASSGAVNGAPVTITGTGNPRVSSASVTPSPLAFGNWANGTTSNAMTLTVTNTGNVALAGGTITFGGGTPQPFSRPAGAAARGTCAVTNATLAVGASCTINVVFAPTGTTQATFSRTLTVAFTGATVTPTAVILTGTGVTTRGTVTITPAPLTITLEAGILTNAGTVTLTNNAASPSNVAITGVNVTNGAGPGAFNIVLGADHCTGANLMPGASCTVDVRYSRLIGTGTKTGTVNFTDTATGSPQHGTLTGIAQ